MDFGVRFMANRIKFISPIEANKWFTISNLFAKSLLPFREALKQFNNLSAIEKREIIGRFCEYDNIRNTMIPKTLDKSEIEDAYFTCVMVDANIIATEYNIDPLTAVMCMNAPSKHNEKIIIK